MDKKRFVLWGSAGNAKVLNEIICSQGDQVVYLFDNNPSATSVIDDVPIGYGLEAFQAWVGANNPSDNAFFGLAAIGGSHGQTRIDMHQVFNKANLTVPILVSSHACISTSAVLGVGSQVLANSVVATESTIGRGCLVNHGAQVDHECTLGDGVHVAPGATLCGCVHVGSNAMIGAGATVLPRIKIGNNTIIGAGSVVTKDIPSNVVAFGNPARVIKSRT